MQLRPLSADNELDTRYPYVLAHHRCSTAVTKELITGTDLQQNWDENVEPELRLCTEEVSKLESNQQKWG